jgi:hypothetical protein
MTSLRRCCCSPVSLAIVLSLGVLLPFAQGSTYHTVDSQVNNGPMVLARHDYSYDSVNHLWEFDLLGTNTSASETLFDVHLVQQFVWDFTNEANQIPYAWDDGAKLWRHPNNIATLATYNVQGQMGLMSMDRAIVDTPLSWTLTLAEGGTTATVLAADLLPSVSLGDFAPGQTKAFIVYMASAQQNPIDTVAFFVAVPEPSTLALLAAGAVVLLGCAWRRRKTGEID